MDGRFIILSDIIKANYFISLNYLNSRLKNLQVLHMSIVLTPLET